jgi:hypothetical protein
MGLVIHQSYSGGPLVEVLLSVQDSDPFGWGKNLREQRKARILLSLIMKGTPMQLWCADPFVGSVRQTGDG